MAETIHYVLADPSGNTTILVLDDVDPGKRAALAARLLRPDCVGAEQVGFYSEAGGSIRVHMMGGEFCGNASRSAAAYAARRHGRTGDFQVSCSGCAGQLQAQVSPAGADGAYDAEIEMPLPETVEALIVDVGGQPCRFFRVDFSGIVHFVCLCHGLEELDRELYWQSIKDYNSQAMPDALGMVLFDPQVPALVPAVFVPATDTLYWEQSCGSGTAAVGAVMAALAKRDIAAAISQPGGVITVKAAVAQGGLAGLRIGGPVKLGPEEEITL